MFYHKPDQERMVWEVIPNTEPVEDQITVLQKILDSAISSPKQEIENLSLKDKLSFITKFSEQINDFKKVKFELDLVTQQLELEKVKTSQNYKNQYIDKLLIALQIYKEIQTVAKPKTNEEFKEELDKIQNCLNLVNRIQVSEVAGL